MLKINNSAESAELYITGDIVDDTDGAALAAWDMGDGYEWPADIRSQLDAMRGKPLTVYINSDGGSVPAGVAIANMIARHDAPTRRSWMGGAAPSRRRFSLRPRRGKCRKTHTS